MGMDYKCTRPVRNRLTLSHEVLNRNSGFIVFTQATGSGSAVYLADFNWNQ